METKTEFVEEKQLCINCLRTRFLLKVCTSPYKCKACDRYHHTFCQNACQKLNLVKQRHNLVLTGFGGKTFVCTATLNLEIKSSSSNTLNVKVFVSPKLTQNTPSQNVDLNLFEEHQNVTNADPQFFHRGRLDMILCADVFEEIFVEKEIMLSKGLVLGETVFGWVVIGQTDIVIPQTFHFLDVSLQNFWKIGAVPRISTFYEEELLYQDHYTPYCMSQQNRSICRSTTF